MKKMLLGLSCAALLLSAGCQKNDCQTYLQGSWVVVNPNDSAMVGIDSVLFFKGDSIKEKYKGKLATDTFKYYYSSYFVNDYCSVVNYSGVNTWDAGKTSFIFDILSITADQFQFRNKTDSISCSNDCIIYMHR